MHSAEDTGTSTPASFLVGAWTVTPSRNLLARNGEEVRVEPRVMDVLVHLVAHAGQPVSKEELIQTVWRNRHVTDDVLTVTIYALRRALGDSARRPQYIETVSRRGYRLVATTGPVPASLAAPLTTPTRESHRISRAFVVAALVLLSLAAAGTSWLAVADRRVDARPSAASADAHEAYVKGRYFLDQRSVRGWRLALEQFQHAATLDPRSAATHAGLADTYSAMADFGVASAAELRPRAMQEIDRALALDADSAEALAALGRAQLLFDWDFSAAARSLTRAATLAPDYMPTYQTTAWLQSARGHHAEAIAAARRARQLDPTNVARYTELARVLALAGRHEAALDEIDRALQLNSRSLESYAMRGWMFELTGRADDAFAAYRHALQLSGVPEDSLRRLEDVYRESGLAGYYRNWLNRSSIEGALSETWRAQLYVRVGELDQAVAALERAYDRREGALAWVHVEPGFQPLRSDVRFQQIAARVGRLD